MIGVMAMKVYYYPTCNTCKKAMKWLDEKGIPYSKKHIVDSNLTYKEVEEIYKKSKLDVQKLFNTSGLVYRELNLKDKLKEMDLQQKLELLASNGMLLKRPLLVQESTVIVGFNKDVYEEKLG
ncbi:MAG: hypothetical protein RL613_1366 [Fusobacteriota bacterium]|jgi:arsenate reductase